ncbi:MAG: hypothetical protein ABSA83_10015 [Verrucomicrobiota bacterium]
MTTPRPPIIEGPPVIAPARTKPLANPRDWICQQCLWIGRPKTYTKGSIILELFLWCMLVVPGIIYSIWRLTSRAKVCRVCGSEAIIPCRSPRGLQMVDFK